jgi:hypothetical protein
LVIHANDELGESHGHCVECQQGHCNNKTEDKMIGTGVTITERDIGFKVTKKLKDPPFKGYKGNKLNL